MKIYISGLVIILINALLAGTPVVEKVHFEQRTDGSLLVDIYYDISDADDDTLDVLIEASAFYSEDWSLPCSTLSGDVGRGIPTGTDKHVVWDFFADNPGISGDGFRVRVTAYDNLSGQTIFEDVTLTEDLEWIPGTGYVIKIGTSNITLDLGGHTIYGDMLKNGYTEGIIVTDVDNITITNGTLDGFGGAVIMSNSNNTMFENLTIQNLDSDDQDEPISGIILSRSKNVTIRKCQFEYLSVAHKGAVTMGNCNVTIDSIQIHGGGTGIDFGGDFENFEPSSGVVKNSRFDGIGIAGILLHYADSVRIANNIMENGAAIYTWPSFSGCVRRVTFEENEISGSNIGILFYGTIESIIRNNIITNNVEGGISLMPFQDCDFENPGPDCFYSTGNVITDNYVVGNSMDLYHHKNCTGNIWERNTFETAQGAEIFSTDPITAAELLSAVDSTAQIIVPDAQLLLVASWTCDTTGKSYEWAYLYKSESQQKQYEFRIIDEKIIQCDPVSIGWMIGDDSPPITESWIDSDSAIVIADSMGGNEFRETFNLKSIEMSLMHLSWTVHYVSQDSIFTVYFDASMR